MILTTAITGGRRAEREDAQREARLAGGDSKHATTLYYVGAATLFCRDPKKKKWERETRRVGNMGVAEPGRLGWGRNWPKGFSTKKKYVLLSLFPWRL